MKYKKEHFIKFFYIKLIFIVVIVGFLGLYQYKLLYAQSNPEQVNAVGYTPLMEAINNAELGAIKSLIDRGANVNAQSQDNYEMSVLELAIFNGNEPKTPDIVKLLLNAGANTSLQDKQGNTPLHQIVNVTAPGAKNEVARLLMEYQAPINKQNFDNGNTPMHTIVQIPQLDLAQYMLENFGPMMDLSIKNKAGDTVVDLARRNVVIDIMNPYLQSNKQRFGVNDAQKRDSLGYTGLMLAIIRNDYDFARQQIKDRNADVNAQADNRYGNRPLQLACMREDGALPYVELLLDNGADPRLANKHGETPLHLIFNIHNQKDREKVATLLLQKGAYLLATDADGNTPLHRAVLKKDTQMINFFKDKLGTWVKNKNNMTAKELALVEKLRVF